MSAYLCCGKKKTKEILQFKLMFLSEPPPRTMCRHMGLDPYFGNHCSSLNPAEASLFTL